MNGRPMKYFATWLKTILMVAVIGLGSVPLVAEAALPALPAYPVIFIHGLKSDNTTWIKLKTYLVNDNGWKYGGNIELRYFSNGVFSISNWCPTGDICTPNTGNFFTVKIIPNDDLYLVQQGYAVRDAISWVRAYTGHSKVILVGHSMGGLAARAYLQGVAAMYPGALSSPYSGDVAKLITIGTPHLGSEASVVLQNTFGLSLLSKPIAFKELDPIESVGLPILNNLKAYPLPPSVAYRSIVGEGGNDKVIAGNGDGIVNDMFQNMANIGGFPPSLDHRAWFHNIHPCESSYWGIAINEAVAALSAYTTGLLGISVWGEKPIVQVHTCEPGDSNVRETLINELTPTYTDTASPPAAVNFPAPIQYAPTNNTSVDISAADVALSWSPISNATSYRIMASENSADLTTNPNVSTCPNCVINDTTASSSYTIPASCQFLEEWRNLLLAGKGT